MSGLKNMSELYSINNDFGHLFSGEKTDLGWLITTVTMARAAAKLENSPKRTRDNWAAISNYLGSDEIGPLELQKLKPALQAYIVRGLAPSKELQPAFDTIRRMVTNKAEDMDQSKVPEAIFDAFDKILATDEQIAAYKGKNQTHKSLLQTKRNNLKEPKKSPDQKRHFHGIILFLLSLCGIAPVKWSTNRDRFIP